MLSDYWKYLQGNEQNMKKFFTAVVDAVEDMKDKDKYAYAKAYFTVHESIFGTHFSEELVKWAVSCMENVDGTTGEHWTLQQTTSLATSQGVSANRFDFYYTMNMLYSDYFEVLDRKSVV